MMQPGSWRMVGGLDLTTPRIDRARQPGNLILCVNHEARSEGYRRIDGYERFDGRPPPSGLPFPLSSDTEMEATAKRSAIAARRNAIGGVPGVGALLGVWRFNERTYAFRRKDGADEIGIYGSSEDGWEEIALKHRIFVHSMNGTMPDPGDVLTGATSGATVTLRRLVRLKGDFDDATAEGFLIVDPTGGTIQADELLTWAGKADEDQIRTRSAPAAQAIAWTGAAHFRFRNHNFYGRAGAGRMYGVSGTDYGFEWDGAIFTPMVTGVTNDTPTHIEAHQNHIFLGYDEGSVIASSLGNPVVFDAVEGAAEIGTGGELTGLLGGYRETLFVFGRNRVSTLRGSSAADWHFEVLDIEAGAMENTIQLLDEPTCYDDRGIRNLTATDRFGDFGVAALSEKIRPLLDAKREAGALPVSSARIRTKSQYRLWFDDGDCIVMGFVASPRGNIYRNFSVSRFDTIDRDENDDPVGVSAHHAIHVCSVEDRDGRERVFAAFQDTAYIYELERSINFDGSHVHAVMQLPFNDFGTPATIKRFREIAVECDSDDISHFRIAANYDDGREIQQRDTVDLRVTPGGGFWDIDRWGEFVWGGEGPDNVVKARLGGRGRNIAPVFYSRGAEIPPYVISGATVLFVVAKLRR